MEESSSAVQSQMRSELAGLNLLNDVQIRALVDLILIFLMDPSKSDAFQTGLGSYAESHGYLQFTDFVVKN